MTIFRREIVRDITVITLEIQSLDAANASHVTACLEEAMLGEAKTVVDLGTLRYFDVSGFAAILRWAAAGSSEGPAVRLCSRCGTVHALLELLQADKVVLLYQSREAAMASLRNADSTPRKGADAYQDEDALAGRRAASA